MNVINIHQRVIPAPVSNILPLIHTLASKEDRVWPKEQWPKMQFKDGLKIGSKGGHGPVRYTISSMADDGSIEFEFSKPNGFLGSHKFELKAINDTATEIKHTIAMRTNLWGSIQWLLAIRSLHDALLEDCFDKIENQFSEQKKKTSWSLWVRMLRLALK
ncbi:MAG: hypothetical protein AB8G22_11460 [Saprospiraceae bacterium]